MGKGLKAKCKLMMLIDVITARETKPFFFLRRVDRGGSGSTKQGNELRTQKVLRRVKS